MTEPAVSVIVPLYNGRGFVARCLESVPDDAELIVVDDGSTDGAPDLVAQRFPRATLLRNDRNRGFGATCNRGLHAATGRVRVVLNSDAVLGPGALHALVAAFDDPEVGIAGARLRHEDGTHHVSAASFPRPGSLLTGSFLVNELYRRVRPNARFRWELGLAARDHAVDRDVDWVLGTCLAIRDRCLADVGGFDEGFYLYAEETDLCWRAARFGWRVRLVAGAEVRHTGGGSTGDPTVRARHELRGEARFLARAYGPSVLRRWRVLRVAGSAVKTIAFGLAGLVDQRARTRARWHRSALRCALGRSWRPALPLGAPIVGTAGSASADAPDSVVQRVGDDDRSVEADGER